MVRQSAIITTQTGTEERFRNAVISAVIQLVVALVGLAVSIRVYTYINNIKAGAFWSHSILVIGSFLFLLGLQFKQQGRNWMIGGMVFNAIALIMSFIGIILDAVQAGHIAETDFTRCVFSPTANTVQCVGTGGVQSSCSLEFNEHTCYCCYLYRQQYCDTYGLSLSTRPNYYIGASCEQVHGEFQALLWTSMGFNIFGFIIAIVAFAFVANYRNSFVHVQQVPISMMLSQSLGESYDGRISQHPVVIFSQQQAVGYYTGNMQAGLPYPVAPPDYNTAMSTEAPPVVPGSALTQPPGGSAVPMGLTPVEGLEAGMTSFSAPYGDIDPPPYAP